LRTQSLADLIQGQVWLLANQRQQQPGVLFQSRLAAPAPLRRRTPALLPALHPSDRRAGAYRKALTRRPTRGPARDGIDNTLTQILRTLLGHRSSPQSAMPQESLIQPRLRIPYDSTNLKPALEHDSV